MSSVFLIYCTTCQIHVFFCRSICRSTNGNFYTKTSIFFSLFPYHPSLPYYSPPLTLSPFFVLNHAFFLIQSIFSLLFHSFAIYLSFSYSLPLFSHPLHYFSHSGSLLFSFFTLLLPLSHSRLYTCTCIVPPLSHGTVRI